MIGNYNDFLQEIASLQNTITKAEERANAKIIRIRTELENEIGLEKAQLEETKKALEELVLQNKDVDFKDKKSHDFPAGKISIRKSGAASLVIHDEKATIKILKELGFTHAIKVEESVKKAVVKDMDNLEQLGCELKEPEERVYIETFKTILTSTGMQ